METRSREISLPPESIKTPEKKLSPKDHLQGMVYPLLGALKIIERQKSKQITTKQALDELTRQFNTILLKFDLASDAASEEEKYSTEEN